MNLLRGALLAAVIAMLLASDATRAAEVRVSTREELARAFDAAKPGTTILLAPGTYRGGLSATLRGTQEQPIVVAAADPMKPPVIEGGGSGLHLRGPEHLELRGLVFAAAEANGLNIDDGGRKDAPAQHVTLRDLVVRNSGPRGNRDGIKLSGLDDFRVVGCTVERWGTSGSGIDMVGCHRGEVASCTFRHSGADFANGVQAKGGSSQIAIRRCRFDHAGGRAVNLGGNTGLEHFRPKPQGYEAREITVEDCTFLGSMAPICFVGVDGAEVRHNTIYRPGRWVVRILQENQAPEFAPCKNGKFTNNVIAFRSDEVRQTVNVGGGTSPNTFAFEGNVWHCLDRPAATRNAVQLPVRETGALYDATPKFRAADTGDLTLTEPLPIPAGVRKE